MKTKKMSIDKIKNVLGRDEMKGIMAGSNMECTIWCCITNNQGTSCRYVCTWQGCW